ncbi:MULTISPECIES: chromate transporter [unclassified Paraburkholderia]|uniref:chromate transporter n=1 Tax=unclassified Paraburkholderia TaxID=2615204 RepID=UPI0038BB4AB2
MRSTGLSSEHSTQADSALELLAGFCQLGLTCFDGPIAHPRYFRREFVERHRWLDDETFADFVLALFSSLPRPASSQVGFSTGLLGARWLGGLSAWPWVHLALSASATRSPFDSGSTCRSDLQRRPPSLACQIPHQGSLPSLKPCVSSMNTELTPVSCNSGQTSCPLPSKSGRTLIRPSSWVIELRTMSFIALCSAANCSVPEGLKKGGKSDYEATVSLTATLPFLYTTTSTP